MALKSSADPSPPPPPLSARRSFLAPADLAAAACTHRGWRQAVEQDEPLWRALCESEFGLRAACGLDRQPLPGYRAAYAAWKGSLGKYGALAGRAARAWFQLEGWLQAHFPPAAESLRCAGAGRAARRRCQQTASRPNCLLSTVACQCCL